MPTLTLLLTDVVGSARLWASEPAVMDAAMARHHLLVHGLVAEHGGWRPVDQGEGDAVFAAFSSPMAALACAAGVQRALAAELWPTSVPLTVRIGVHLGEVSERDGNLFGNPVNRCARIRGLGAGGQVLLSSAVYETVRESMPADLGVSDLGEHRLKDLSRPVRVFGLTGAGLDGPFPPLAGLDVVRHNLPVQTSSFVGREEDLAGLVAAVREHRLVTLTGFGGMGKTRLALQAAAELADASVGDVWFVDLAAVTDPALVPARVAETVGIRWGLGEPLPALVAALRETPTLLVLDNLEQVLGCAPMLAELLERAPSVRVLATSREPLRVRSEQQVPLEPMALPTQTTGVTAATLSTYEAVQFFVDRACAVRPNFTITNETAPAVAAICARLDGHPLALELAAARLKVLSVEQLLARLDSTLAVLTGGSRDMPERHQTLRATIAWSFDTLSRDEQLLLTRLAVLPAPAGMEMVEAVCGEGLDVLDLLGSLVDKSLVTVSEADAGPRFGMLVSIRQYATEQTDPTTLAALADRHADHIHTTLAGIDLTTMAGYRQLHTYVATELAHVRAALAHGHAQGPAERFVEMVALLDDTFFHRGLLNELTELVTAALPTARGLDPLSPELLARLLTSLVLAQLSFPVSLHDIAVEAVAAARRCVEPAVRAEVLSITLLYAATSLADARVLLAELDEAIDASAGKDVLVDERHYTAATALRYADPAAAEEAARDMDPSDLVRRPVRISELLLDRGECAPALEVLANVSDHSFTGIPNPGWAMRIGVTRSSALTFAGRFAESRAAVDYALAQTALTGAPPLIPTAVLADLERATGNPQAAVSAIDTVLADLPPAAMVHLKVVALRWRRVVCLRQLDQPLPPAELADCRDLLAADALHGPRDLLAVLVERAVQVADNDPEKAAAILASVQAHRGRWVLPFGMDADTQALLPRLPALPTDPAHPTAVW